MSIWYVIVDATGRYMPLVGGNGQWVNDIREAEVFTGLGHAKQAMKHRAGGHPGCRIERIPRLPARIPR